MSSRVSICGQLVPGTSVAIEAMMRCGRTHVSTPHQTNKSNQSRKLFAHFPNLIHYSGHAIVAPAGSKLDNIMRGEIGGSINTINSRTALRSTYHPSNSMGEFPQPAPSANADVAFQNPTLQATSIHTNLGILTRLYDFAHIFVPPILWGCRPPNPGRHIFLAQKRPCPTH